MKTGWDEIPKKVQKEILTSVENWQDRVSRQPGEHNVAPFQAMLISLVKLSIKTAREEVLELACDVVETYHKGDSVLSDEICQAYKGRFNG